MVISQCMIENDIFQRKNMLHIGQQKVKPCPQGIADLDSYTVM